MTESPLLEKARAVVTAWDELHPMCNVINDLRKLIGQIDEARARLYEVLGLEDRNE